MQNIEEECAYKGTETVSDVPVEETKFQMHQLYMDSMHYVGNQLVVQIDYG